MFESLSALLAEFFASPSALVGATLGTVLLFGGRRLYWLLVAAVGFVLGYLLAQTWMPLEAMWVRWGVALVCGVLGGLAVVLLQKLALTIGGALAAGYAAWWYLDLGEDPLEIWHWALVAAAATGGLLVARRLFDLGLVVVSALAGATLILQALEPGAETSRWLLPALAGVGALVQMMGLRRSKKLTSSKDEAD